MSRPLVATYRLQFREGTTFASARDLAGYLKRIGVSHLYASPIFAASPGSTHGYDVVDYNHFEEGLGGDEGFVEMSDALSREDVGLILDFVPNHMGVSPENGWWEDVLTWGADSRHHDTFDISWNAEKILVPVLGKPYGDALNEGDFTVVFDPDRAALRFDADGYRLPLDPRTLGQVFGFLEHEERDRLVRRFSVATPVEGGELSERLAEHLADESFAEALRAAVKAINQNREALHALHEAQAWRLGWWRTAREKLTYRRFFEIADLIGVRQELRRVFRESHRTVIRLARERRLDGIRIDHVDGLADPKTYLLELRLAFQSVRRSPTIHVEKILTGPERLRTSWQIEGTTGYEFITVLSGLYVDAAREGEMTKAYAEFVGEEEDLRVMITRMKRSIFLRNLAGELAVLTEEALRVAGRGLATRDLGADTMARSIVEVATALPVYRTYVGVDGVPAKDVEIIDRAVELAMSRREVEADEPILFIGRLLKLDFEDGQDVAGALNFTRRFQQTTGAVMAKAVEDTVFYRYNRLIALNEVGGEPDRYGGRVNDFHDEMLVRREDQPEGLLASTTHDTKRSEDARARIYTLSEAPTRWMEIVTRLCEAMAPFRKPIGTGGLHSPDPATEWMFYQSLAGVLPADFDPKDAAARGGLADRMAAFTQKAAREAKRYTSWTDPAAEYEAALEAFTRAAFDPDLTGSFLADFWEQIQPFVVAGALNSLSQTLLKLTVPGVPDIYQGTEFYDFSLVDPDNRRPVDINGREALVHDGVPVVDALKDWRDGRVKAKMLGAGLGVRAEMPALFTRGAYTPLPASGSAADHVVAFARSDDKGAAAVVVVPRLALGLLDGAKSPLPAAKSWGETTIALPPSLTERRFHSIFDGADISAGGELRLGEMLADFPIALLVSG